MEKKSIIYQVARKTTQYLLEIIKVIATKVLMFFGPSNQESDKSRGDTAKDSLQYNLNTKQQKIPYTRITKLPRAISNNHEVYGRGWKAPRIKKPGIVGKR